MRSIKIALIGQPNTGKSSLLNSLAGAKVIVSNYPGTTVEVTKAKIKLQESLVELIDTPGIYSISDASAEEKVTASVIFGQDIDGAVVLVDATASERGLYLVVQILEAGIPTVVGLNFVEEAERKGIQINTKNLESILGVPVIQTNPMTKKGITELLSKMLHLNEHSWSPFLVSYDDHIEKATKIICTGLAETLPLSKRFIAIRILENDKRFLKYLKDKAVLDKAANVLKPHPNVSRDITITRYGEASFVARLVTTITPRDRTRGFQDRLDEALLSPFIGPFITFIFFGFVFAILLFIGGWVQGLLMAGAEKYLISLLPAHGSGLVSSMVTQGFYGLVAGVAIALPYVFLFYIFLGLLEDIGLLSRCILSLERLMRRLGLSGRAFIPAVLGLGCSVPAIRVTRILSSEKERIYAAFLFACIPCSSRTAIIMGIVGFYGGVVLALSVYFTMAASFLICAFVLKKRLKTTPPPLIMEMPSYRKPLLSNVVVKGWVRMQDFVYIVIPLLAAGGALYGLLVELGFTQLIVKPFEPLTVAWLNLPAETIVPLAYGFIQKDLAPGMLVSVLGTNLDELLSPVQLYTFGVASSIQIPCIIAFWMLIREVGLTKASLITALSLAYGLVIAGLMWRIIS
jgi:ferrous iron transport protein B